MTSTSTPTAPASRAGSVDTPTVAGSVLPPETKEKDASDAEKGTLGEHKEIDPSTGEEEEGDRFIGGIKLALLMVGLLCSVFLVALDNTIVSTALPKIVSDFNALAQVVWIVTAYFLTQAGLMLTGGQLLTVTTTKIMFLVSIFIFEIGSLICGVAPTMNALIAGRAIAGVGGATIFVTVLSIMSELLRLKDRPLFFGLLGACWAVSSVVGPLVGGAFTDHVSWRWCFYINLPFGGLALATVIFFMPNRKARARPGTEHMTALDRWKKIDFVGSVLGLGLVTALLLALQWGGQTKPWSDGSVIACFVVFGVLVLIFLAWERYLGDDAMVPLYLLKNRTQVGATLESFMLFLALLIGIYYLPLWYQAKGHSAVRSGIDVLPFQLGTVASVMICGAIINTTGRYWPFLCFPPLLISVASGLLYTIDVNTPNARVIGYQILLGVGAGAALQNGILAIQAEYADREHMVPQTTAIVSWGQLIGGIIGIAIAGTIFASGLGKYLPLDLPENIRQEVRSSVSVVFTLPEPQRSTVIAAYIKSIDRVFLLGIPAGVLASLSSFLIKNYNLKERSQLHATGASI